MTARCVWLVALIVMGLSVAVGALQERSAGVGVRLRFPDGVDLTGLSINYFLSGGFGGFGGFVRTRPDVREYVLDTSREGQPAKMIKAIIYCPGYRTVLFTPRIPVERPDDTVSIRLEPLTWLPLAGRVIGIADPQRLSMEIVYLVYWSHAFFGILDGPVASFTVASTSLNRDGSFVTRVPDFARDPVIASRPAPDRGRLKLIAREVGTGNIRYSLEMADVAEKPAELSVAETYPQDLMLVAVVR